MKQRRKPQGMRKAMRSLDRRALAFLAACMISFVPAAAAEADLEFGPDGSAAGQTRSPGGPNGLAVDDVSGDVYVADTGNNRVDVFDSTGTFIRAFGWGVISGSAALEVCTDASGCQAGLPGAAAGQFNGPRGVSVDNDPLSPSYRDVFVFSSARIQRFTPDGEFVLAFGDGVNQSTNGDICTASSGHVCRAGQAGAGPNQLGANSLLGVGPGGVVHVLGPTTDRVQKFDSAGVLLDELTIEADGGFPGILNGFAVDSSGRFYTGSAGAGGAVRRYDSTGDLQNVFNPSFNIRSIAVDYTTGRIFVADAAVSSPSAPAQAKGVVRVYAPTSAQIAVTYGDRQRYYPTLAANVTSEGEVYAVGEVHGDGSVDTKIVRLSLPPPGPVVLPGLEINRAEPVGNVRATLRSGINAVGSTTTYHFEYVDDANYENDGFDSPAVERTTEASVNAGYDAVAVSAQVNGLTPETLYHFRIVASNDDGVAVGGEVTFETKEPVVIGDTFASRVDRDRARLTANVNPLGISVDGYFEYVDDASYQESGFSTAALSPDVSKGENPLEFGDAEDAFVARSTDVSGLAPGTVYHFRFVGMNEFVTRPGPVRVIKTFSEPDADTTSCANQEFRVGRSAVLPGCRAYEMVSPARKEGGDVAPAYGYKDGRATRLNQASPAGGRLTFSAFRSFGDADGAPFTSQYLATRASDAGWEIINISPPRVGFAPFSNDSYLLNPYKAFTEDLCSGYLLQDTDVPLTLDDNLGYADLYRRKTCADTSYELLTSSSPANGTPGEFDSYHLAVQGFSADGSAAVLRANGKLTGNATGADYYQLYFKEGSNLRLVSVMPNGSPAPGNASVGTKRNISNYFSVDSLENAVAANGSAVYWTLADSDPTRVGDTWANAHAGPGRLFVRTNPGRAQSPVSDGACSDPDRACTFPISDSVSDDKAAFIAAARDGSGALFRTCASVLVNLGCAGGNLYVFDLATRASTVVGTNVSGILGASADLGHVYFSSKDVLAPGAESGTQNLYHWSASTGHRFIGKLHNRDLTFGRGWLSPVADAPGERSSRVSADGTKIVFTSQAALTGMENRNATTGEAAAEVFLFDSDTAELRCVSCLATGGRPDGEIYVKGVVGEPPLTIASYIPGWESSHHPSRVFSEDGDRIFFLSFQALEPRDVNDKQDVYQWQKVGTGDCDAGASSFNADAGGCVRLISSGQGQQDSFFVDASSDGSDVFVSTVERLVAGDEDDLVDIYDARVGGGFPAEVVSTPCEGDDCQGDSAVPPADDETGSSEPGEGNGRPPNCAAREAALRKARQAVRRMKRKARSAPSKRAKRGVKQAKRKLANRRGKLIECRKGGLR